MPRNRIHAFRADDPAGAAIDAVLPRGGEVRHHRGIPYGQVARAVAAVRASGASIGTKLAFEFLVLTAARSGEVRLATWDEVDLDAGVWTVPAERMKMGASTGCRCPRGAWTFCAKRRDAERAPIWCSRARAARRSRTAPCACCCANAVPHGFRSSFSAGLSLRQE